MSSNYTNKFTVIYLKDRYQYNFLFNHNIHNFFYHCIFFTIEGFGVIISRAVMLFRLSSITGTHLKSSRSNLALTLLDAKSAASTFTCIKSYYSYCTKLPYIKYLHKVYNILTLEEKKNILFICFVVIYHVNTFKIP